MKSTIPESFTSIVHVHTLRVNLCLALAAANKEEKSFSAKSSFHRESQPATEPPFAVRKKPSVGVFGLSNKTETETVFQPLRHSLIHSLPRKVKLLRLCLGCALFTT